MATLAFDDGHDRFCRHVIDNHRASLAGIPVNQGQHFHLMVIGATLRSALDATDESFVHFNRIVPVYPLTEGLPQRWLRGLIWRTLEKYQGQESGVRDQVKTPATVAARIPDPSHLTRFAT